MTEQNQAKPQRRRRRKDARPGEIVDAGLAAFSENGFSATRLEDIARRAGIAKSTIYLYFENKEAVFEAAIKANMANTMDDLSSQFDAFDGPTEDLIRLVLRVMYAKLLEPNTATLMRIMIAEGHRFPDLAERYHREVILRGERVMTALMKRGVERGEFDPGPAQDFPRLIAAPTLMAMIATQTFSAFEEFDVDAYFEAHVWLLMNGLRIS